MNTLYIFITHQGNINNCYDRIKNMMISDFIVVVGGFIKDSFDKESNILRLNCNDTYGGLPEKVMKTFHYIISDNYFNNYNYFCKLDDDMVVLKKIENINYDYFGVKETVEEGDRKWHVGKCHNLLDKMEYIGDYPNWCLGGNGYVLSRYALENIVPNFDYIVHLYEDVYIASILKEKNIYPTHIKNLHEYLFSPSSHNYLYYK